jgi:hypothetical protein
MFRPITRIPGLPGRTSLLFVSAAWRDDLSASSRLSQVALRYRKHAAKPNLLQVTAVQRLTLLYRGQPVVPGGFRPASLATYHRLRLLRLRRASPRLVCGVRQRRSRGPATPAFVPIRPNLVPSSPKVVPVGTSQSIPSLSQSSQAITRLGFPMARSRFRGPLYPLPSIKVHQGSSRPHQGVISLDDHSITVDERVHPRCITKRGNAIQASSQ